MIHIISTARRLWLALLLTLTGCSSVLTPQPNSADLVIPAHAYTALIAELKNEELRQLVTVNYQNEQNSLLFMIESEPDSLRMLILTPLSIPVVSLHQSASGLKQTMHLPIALPIPAQAIIRDYLLATLSADQLNRLLAPFDISVNEGEGERLITQYLNPQAQPLLRVSHQQQASAPSLLLIEHLALGYRLQVQPLGAQAQ